MDNSYESFYAFVTLLVSNDIFQKEVLEFEPALKLLYKVTEAPEPVGRLFVKFTGHPEFYDATVVQTKFLWDSYKKNGEEEFRSFLSYYKEIMDSIKSEES